MSVFRAVFLGTPEFAKICLQNMISDEHFDIVGVVTQPDRPKGRKMQLSPSPVKQLAQENDIQVISPEKINSPDVLAEIKRLNAEVAVVVAFGQIMGQEFLDLFPNKVVNVHGSLLPHLRGAAPIQRAVINGDKETGVALQVMVKALDAGDVIGVRKTLITDNKDALTLHDELAELGCELLAIDLCDYLRGNLAAKPQDQTRVTFAPKLDKSEGKIDWSLPAVVIFNLIRGMKLGPGSYTSFNGKKLKLHNTEVFSSSGKAGEITEILGDGFIVACGDQSLKIVELQPESKSKMLAKDFIRGYQLKLGDHFG